ncbi:MAG TPA: glycosyltransferase family A protein [Elusimicrobiota bacterium]|nr:glycosyltransferase family A protein [Elusimicrobiota bacterium]
MSFFISVILPCHNRRRFFAQALAGLSQQTFRNFELIIVDDASAPPLLETVRRARLPRWRYLYLGKNRGPAEARNLGIRNAEGDLIALLDSDDVWYPQKLAVQVRCFADPKIDFVYSNVSEIDGRGRVVLRKVIREGDLDPASGLPKSLPYTSTIVLRKKILARVGLFDPGFRHYYDDSDFWCRVLKKSSGRIHYLSQALAAYRMPRGKRYSPARYSLSPSLKKESPRIVDYFLDQAYFTIKRRRADQPLPLKYYRHGRNAGVDLPPLPENGRYLPWIRRILENQNEPRCPAPRPRPRP